MLIVAIGCKKLVYLGSFLGTSLGWLGGWMRVLRRCMVQEILATLEILEGESSKEAALHRKRAMYMFMKSRADKRTQESVLSCLPNGDWRLLHDGSHGVAGGHDGSHECSRRT